MLTCQAQPLDLLRQAKTNVKYCHLNFIGLTDEIFPTDISVTRTDGQNTISSKIPLSNIEKNTLFQQKASHTFTTVRKIYLGLFFQCDSCLDR